MRSQISYDAFPVSFIDTYRLTSLPPFRIQSPGEMLPIGSSPPRFTPNPGCYYGVRGPVAACQGLNCLSITNNQMVVWASTLPLGGNFNGPSQRPKRRCRGRLQKAPALQPFKNVQDLEARSCQAQHATVNA